MEWLNSLILGSTPTIAAEPPSPPCVAALGPKEFILSETLDHVQCFLEWRANQQAPSVDVSPSAQQEDCVTFGEVEQPPPLSILESSSKENVLLVLINSPQIAESQLQNIHKSLNVSALYCPKNRFPSLPFAEFEKLIVSIVEWKTTRPNGLIVYASQNAASKQLLLYLGAKIYVAPNVNLLDKMLKDLDELQKFTDKSFARTYSFVVQPLHPSPKTASGSLFASQLNFLKHWAAWRQEPPSMARPTPKLKLRMTGITLSVTAHQHDLLKTFSDEHPTLEIWLSTDFAISSRPALTLKNVEANESTMTQGNTLVSCGVNVQTLELINSVVRRNENSSYHWECELETAASDGDLLIRIFNSKAMFRIQLHALFFKSHQPQRSTSVTELLVQNSEIDGYDLFYQDGQEGDQLRIKLSLEITK